MTHVHSVGLDHCQAGTFCGIAVTVNEQNDPLPEKERFIGQSLKDVASLCGHGVSSGQRRNCCPHFYKRPGKYAKFGTGVKDKKKKIQASLGIPVILRRLFPAVAGKSCCYRSFYSSGKSPEKCRKLVVLERKPAKDDLPDTACEYILPDQDFVFITGQPL